MKRFLYVLFLSGFLCLPSLAEETNIHPIDTQESACKAEAKNLDEWTMCSLKAARAWNREVDKYYSLLYKKLQGEAKTNLFEDQKYWNMYKNNEYKVIDSLKDKNFDTKERVIFRANQKREIIKLRAAALRMYYAQTFPDDEQQKLELNNSNYQPDNLLQHGLRLLQF